MSWTYRVVRRKDGDDEEYAIHEFYPQAWSDSTKGAITTRSIPACGETLDELRRDLERQMAALDKPVLNYEDF